MTNGVTPTDWSHIEIVGATVTEAYIDNGFIKQPCPDEIGKFRFFIDVIETDGGRLCLDSCDRYDEAIQLAEEARVDFEISLPVRDRVVGDN